MYRITLQDIAKETGFAYSGPESVVAREVVIDSRAVRPGALFVALKGEKADGHEYITEAIAAGAVGIVVSDPAHVHHASRIGVILVPEGGTHFLQSLARLWRARFKGPVVAITGSQGKTSTKDLLGQVLAGDFRVVRTRENQNNELGLPLTMTQLSEETDLLLVEMGMDDFGDIDFLADIASPTHGIITGIGLSHAEQLGSREGIASAKAELIAHLTAEGHLVLRGQDYPLLAPHLEGEGLPNITWCCREDVCEGGRADCVAKDIVQTSDGSAFECHTWLGDRFSVQVPFPGAHYVDNTLLVIAMAKILGLNQETISERLENAQLQSADRMAYHLLSDGVLLINDSYNANPDAMKATLEVLAGFQPRQTIACLGDMLDLGSYEEAEHHKIGAFLVAQGIGRLVTVGPRAEAIAAAALDKGMQADHIRVCTDNACAGEAVQAFMEAGAVVLVKGSHGVHMEEVCSMIRNKDLRRNHTC